MKAIGFREHGDISKMALLDMPKPSPGPGEVLIEMKASAYNHLDLWVRDGWPGLDLPLPHISGSDGAGVVAELGEGVSGLEVGERVAIDPGFSHTEDEFTARGEHSVSPGYAIFGEHGNGAHAEYVAIPAENALPIPRHISFEQAAATGLVFLTAWRMLMHRAQLRAGESVLIIGAGGGVNSAAVQIAHLAGCKIYALTSTAEKMAQAKDLGADVVLNYVEDPKWSKTLYKMTNKRGVDVVVDNVGAATLSNSLRAVRRGGRIVIVGNTSGPKTELDIRFIFGKQISLIGSTMGNHQDYRTVMNLMFEGKLQPVIDRVFDFDHGIEAMKHLEAGNQFGKVVLNRA